MDHLQDVMSSTAAVEVRQPSVQDRWEIGTADEPGSAGGGVTLADGQLGCLKYDRRFGEIRAEVHRCYRSWRPTDTVVIVYVWAGDQGSEAFASHSVALCATGVLADDLERWSESAAAPKAPPGLFGPHAREKTHTWNVGSTEIRVSCEPEGSKG